MILPTTDLKWRTRIHVLEQLKQDFDDDELLNEHETLHNNSLLSF